MQIGHMLETIKAYHAELGYDYKYESAEKQMEHILQLHTALGQENAEFLDWLPWKPWREIKDQTCNKEEAALELIDVFFFTAALWSAIGMKPEEFEELFKVKLAENLSRISRGYNKNGGDVKIRRTEL